MINPSNFKSQARRGAIAILIMTFIMAGCNKEKLGQAIGNSGPCYCYGGGTSTFSNYSLSIKKDKTYPPGSKLAIDQHYFSRASPNILSSYRFLDATLPFTDTTITRIDVKDLVIYFNWKILNASNDSVGGGITPKYTTGDTTIRFEINY